MADLRYECGCIQRCPSHVTLAQVVPNEVIMPQIGQQQLTCGNFDMSSEFRVLLAEWRHWQINEIRVSMEMATYGQKMNAE